MKWVTVLPRRARRNDTGNGLPWRTVPRPPYTPIIGTLGYVWDRSTDSVLLVHRVGRADDEQYGKYNGLGGKLERDEGVTAGMRRELDEEAGIAVTSMRLRGTVSWPGFGKNGEDWLGFVFVVEGWEGTPPPDNPEGTLSWVPRARLLAACSDDPAVRDAAGLPMWEGDWYFLPLVFDDDPRAFHGVMPYSNGRPTSWTVERWG
jgi:8-oxo-dGTP diphosphatase